METYQVLFSLAIMVLCLLLQAFFSGSEIGMVSADKIRLRHLAAEGSRGAGMALKFLDRPDLLLSTTLVGTNLMTVVNTTIATWLVVQGFGEEWALLAIVFIAPVIWIFGEVVPKTIFQQKSGVIVPVAVYFLVFFTALLYPLVFLTSKFSQFMAWLSSGDNSAAVTLREEIQVMLDTSPIDKEIKPQEQDMIKRLFDFNETTAREVMIPLVDVVTVSNVSTCKEVMETAAKSYHKLIPVFSERVDNMVGVVNTMDLLGEPAEREIKSLIHKIDYVPSSKSIATLMADMRESKASLVVVVDEFGGAEGIVTLEDIMEEVVDEVRDEFDKLEKEETIISLGNNSYLVSARYDIDELEEELDIQLNVGEQHTSLASLLLDEFDDIPEVGEKVTYKGIVFTITKARPQAIDEVQIQLP